MDGNSLTPVPQQLQSDYGVKALSKLLPIAIAICLTNGLVFFLICRHRDLRTSTNYPLFSLAICDFLTGVVNIPYFIVYKFHFVPLAMAKEFSYWMFALHKMTAVSGAYHILVITAIKYLAIVKPLKHHLLTKKMVLKILLGVWIVSAVVVAIPVVWRESPSPSVWLWHIIYATISLVAVFFVPYVFMIYAYIVMFRAISRRQRPSSVQRDPSRLQRRNNDERKCILVFVTMAIIFACCWLPYFAIMLTIFIKEYLSRDSAGFFSVTEAFSVIRYMTSITNPLLYTFFKRDFWLALRNLPPNRESISLPLERMGMHRGRSDSTDSSRRLTLHGTEKRPRLDSDVNTTFRKQNVYMSSV